MNIVFIGASRFGLRCLELLYADNNCNLVGVITAPQSFDISYSSEGVTNVLYANVEKYAQDRGIFCRTIARNLNDPSLLEEVSSWRPDAFIVVGWYHMIPKAWREIAPAYGLHASLLPDYSGGAPLVWAMINGETRTGITLFQMDDGVDSGPIIGQVEEEIKERDTIATLYARIEIRGLDLLRQSIKKITKGSVEAKIQSITGRKVMPQRSPKDGLIDWNWDSQFIDRFIRAQTKPYPGAYTIIKDKKLIIWSACVIDSNSSTLLLPVGTFQHSEDSCSIVCGEGLLKLQEVEFNGQSLSGSRFLRELLD